MGGPIPKNVHDYDYNGPGIGYFLRGSKYNPDLRELQNNSQNQK